MHCATCRELISADVDGELDELERDAMAAHVSTCPGCAAFRRSIADVHRSVRLSAADVVPDLTDRILADAPVPTTTPARARPTPVGTFLRYALGVVAASQLVLALPELFDPDGSTSTLHAAHHLGAWDLAFAIGLLVVAVQPWRARGLLPMCAALAGVMLVTAVIDVASGRTPGLAESAHALELVGLGLVWRLARAPWAGDGPVRGSGRRAGGPEVPGRLAGLRLLGRSDAGPTTACDRPAA